MSIAISHGLTLMNAVFLLKIPIFYLSDQFLRIRERIVLSFYMRMKRTDSFNLTPKQVEMK